MADFDVKVRNLKTGETMVASMANAEQCCEWLAERPPFLEILGVLSDTSPAEQVRLKESMRPYDEEELKLKAAYDKKLEAAMAAQYAAELKQIEGDKSTPADPNADPNRPISVRYEVDEGLSVVDDERELTDVVRDAVAAWVKERNTWVEAKGQIVGEAHLEVWPGPIPEDEGDERVRAGGQFFPRLKAGDPKAN